MEIPYKKILFSVPAFLISSSLIYPVQALSLPNSGYNNYASGYNGMGGWSFDVGVNYQKFSNNGTSFASTTNTIAGTTTTTDFNIHPDYHTGYDVGIGYHIPVKDSDVRLDYTHLRSTDSSSAIGNNLSLWGNDVDSATGRLKFGYDSVDLTAGHNMVISPSFDVNYYGGLNYTRFTKDMNLSGSSPSDAYGFQSGSNFHGWGPVLGMNATCHPFSSTPGFGVVGGVRTAFPYGTMTGYFREYENGDLVSVSKIPDEKIVVPVVGAKLALKYEYPSNGMKWSTQLGYETTTLFGATKTGNYSGSSINTNIQGFYFNLGGSF